MSPVELARRFVRRVKGWIDAPMPVIRLVIVRVFAPLCILGFMWGRLIHADEWIGDAGYRLPRMPDNPFQPIYVPPLPSSVAWVVVTVMVLSGVTLSLGLWTRTSAVVFGSILTFVAVSDRLAAFTVSKIGPVIVLTVLCGPAGTRFGVDAWRRARRGEPEAPSVLPMTPIRFLQLMLVTFYCASGLAKAGGDWLLKPFVLWTHLHDTYQTTVSYYIAKLTPVAFWTPLQFVVLTFESFSPIWFAWSRTRPLALLFGLGMHMMIGLMFGPVLAFSLLMMTLLIASFAPTRWLERLDAAAYRRLSQSRM